MKTRIDFVSNSSSCSFLIENAEAGLKVLNEFDIMDSLDEYDISARYVLKANVFDKYGIKSHESWRDTDDGIVYCRCRPSEIMQLSANAKKSMAEFEFECEDCNQGAVFILMLLHEALKKIGISVNDTNTEIDLPSFDDGSIVSKLFNCISENTIRK